MSSDTKRPILTREEDDCFDTKRPTFVPKETYWCKLIENRDSKVTRWGDNSKSVSRTYLREITRGEQSKGGELSID